MTSRLLGAKIWTNLDQNFHHLQLTKCTELFPVQLSAENDKLLI